LCRGQLKIFPGDYTVNLKAVRGSTRVSSSQSYTYLTAVITAGCHDIQHNDTERNDTQYNNKNATACIMTLSMNALDIVLLSVALLYVVMLCVANVPINDY
jgi:hypothetical protein